MVEVEKVIRGLECCEHPYAKKCATCPYNSYTPDSMECTGYLCKDILALLKEQEPVKPRWTHPTVDKKVMMCGSCGIAIPLGKPNYCPWCGRKVKWND